MPTLDLRQLLPFSRRQRRLMCFVANLIANFVELAGESRWQYKVQADLIDIQSLMGEKIIRLNVIIRRILMQMGLSPRFSETHQHLDNLTKETLLTQRTVGWQELLQNRDIQTGRAFQCGAHGVIQGVRFLT